MKLCLVSGTTLYRISLCKVKDLSPIPIHRIFPLLLKPYRENSGEILKPMGKLLKLSVCQPTWLVSFFPPNVLYIFMKYKKKPQSPFGQEQKLL